ncbi:hypothetical protein MNBD_GAMMA13-1750 [hydrothermal vent metagenome]|uniref:Crp/Fnr family transcriptional regulator n=1 Tax=hydrothermal vent metagenome TaxID=652676 RepID=A0A3B0YGK4_9ZZZZ
MTPAQKETFLKLLDDLSAVDTAAVVSFAEFLSSRGGEFSLPVFSPPEPPPPVEIPEPEDIPRPEEEKVVAAVKRLSKTYFMLDKKAMLTETSDLVTQHIIQRRDVVEVIDELEAVFSRQYQQLKGGAPD